MLCRRKSDKKDFRIGMENIKTNSIFISDMETAEMNTISNSKLKIEVINADSFFEIEIVTDAVKFNMENYRFSK